MVYSDLYKYYKNKLENYLQYMFMDIDVPQQRVIDAMKYSLLNGGKRLRGVLTLHCAELFDYDILRALPLAAAIEMVHAYSLIHDDLPCMDNDDFRRGKPSCHKKFDEATALLAGDALLTLAFEIVSNAQLENNKMSDIVFMLARAAGPLGMIGGQQLDLESEGKDISDDMLNELHLLKTGELIKAAVGMGCRAGNASQSDIEKMLSYAQNIGLAFQITDDMLDITATEEELGKPIHSDEKNKKTTYVTKYGYEKSKEMAESCINKAILSLNDVESIKGDKSFLTELAKKILDREN